MLVQREREMRDREVVAARLEASLREARLSALRAQLHPHFLFNTLNAISVLAMKGENLQVVEAIGHLSKLLRAALERDLPQTIPLARELDVLERYLDIQRLRFSDRLQVTCELEPGTEAALVPALLLQPLVENAIHHGLSTAGTGRVDIRAARSGDSLVIEVQDDGAGFEREEVRSKGVGLANTRDRLVQLYGERQAMECESPVGGGARVRIRLPFASVQSDA
jgi:LytS/YehU family sensor histidine kinase